MRANLTRLEETINGSAEQEANQTEIENKVESEPNQSAVTTNKWPLKPGVLVHVNSNHSLSPKNQAKITSNSQTNDEANLGLLERNRNTHNDPNKNKAGYLKNTGKSKGHTQRVVRGILNNFRKRTNDSDDSGQYKKIQKSNKRATALINFNKSNHKQPKSRLRSFFQSETANVIVTEGGSTHSLSCDYFIKKLQICLKHLKFLCF